VFFAVVKGPGISITDRRLLGGEDVRREEVELEDQTERRREEGTAQTAQLEEESRAEADRTEGEDLIDKAKRKLQGK